MGYETVCRGERARAKFSAPFRGIVVGGGGQVVRQKGWLLLGGQPFFFASLVVGRFTDEEMHQCYDQNSSLYNDLILQRVNVVFEAFRGQLRRPHMFLEFYHTCFKILPHTFRILPHTLQRACPLQRPLDHTRHNPTGRPGGREAGGREAGRPGGWEAGRPCLLLASCITLF